MAQCHNIGRPMRRVLRQKSAINYTDKNIRTFKRCSAQFAESTVVVQTESPRRALDPNTVTSTREERRLMRSGIYPIGSRRRRAAIRTSDNIPFEQLPYLCFQEARKILLEEREETIEKIKKEHLRISNLLARDASKFTGGQNQKATTLYAMKKYVEELKIQADINDPLIKKRFEDGKGDMNKPIYLHLAKEKWSAYNRKILLQRIKQFSIVPDLLSNFEPLASVDVAFRQRKVQPGSYVDSRVSEFPARLKVQVFNKGEQLISVIMIDADVPVVERDNFMHRCHFLAVNIPLSPTTTSVPLSLVNATTQLVIPWMPPFAQKGSEYHRYSIFVLQQSSIDSPLNLDQLKKDIQPDNFWLRGFVCRYGLRPIGLGLFRSIWDEGTASVMHRASIPGADIALARRKVVALKPKEKPRGWDAKHAHPKYDVFLGKNRRPFQKILRKR